MSKAEVQFFFHFLLLLFFNKQIKDQTKVSLRIKKKNFFLLYCPFYFLKIYLFLAAHRCAQAFSSCSERGPHISCCTGLSLGGFSCCRPWASRLMSWVVVVHGLSMCGIHSMWNLSGPGMESVPLHWQLDSQPLGHQGCPMF